MTQQRIQLIGMASLGLVLVEATAIAFLVAASPGCGQRPTNRFTGKPLQWTYVAEWDQAMSCRPASVPFDRTDYCLIGRAMCEIDGKLGQVYEWAGRDQSSRSVTFVGTPQSVEIRGHLDRVFEETQAIMEICDAGIKRPGVTPDNPQQRDGRSANPTGEDQ